MFSISPLLVPVVRGSKILLTTGNRSTRLPASASRCYSLLTRVPSRFHCLSQLIQRSNRVYASTTATRSWRRMPSTVTSLTVRCISTVYHPWSAHTVAHRGSIRFSGNSASSDENKTQPPKHRASDSAIVVFSNLYFYKSEEDADKARQKRKDFLKEMTVGEIYLKFIYGHTRRVSKVVVSSLPR